MSKINICIIIICVLLFIIIFLLCNNKSNSIIEIGKKMSGGLVDTNIKDLENEIKKEQDTINMISNELKSMKRNKIENEKTPEENDFGKVRTRPAQDDIKLNQQENNTFIMRLMEEEKNNENLKKNKREIVSNEEEAQIIDDNESMESIIEEEEIEEEDEEEKNNVVKAWEDMCDKDDNKNEKKVKKNVFDELKLELNTGNELEPFNNDDFSEFGKFNC